MGTTKGNNAKAALVESLNTLLADYFTLYMKTKNFHWHVAGPDFRDLHLLFDEQGAELYALTDVIAERVRKNGGDTLTSIASIAKATRVKEELRTDIAAKAMAKELRDDNARLVEWIREAKQAAADAGDNATEGMADDWTDQAERRVWFLSQIIA